MFYKDVTNLELWKLEVLRAELEAGGMYPIGLKVRGDTVLYLYDSIKFVEMVENE